MLEEMLRNEPPAELATKTALCDPEIRGRQIWGSELIVVSLAAATPDPDVFAEPERFDICRSDIRRSDIRQPHLVFNYGPQF